MLDQQALRQVPTVLAVDDVPSNLDILVEHLQHESCQLIVALNGKDALNLAKQAQPDLILLDIMMPGLNGYTVCQHLKADPATRDIPVIFVTAMGEDADEERGLNLGAIDYITKPFNIPVLKARVRNHLDIRLKTVLLRRLASIDGLTNIPNRRQFDETLKREWFRCQRSSQPLSVIMIDIDYFKRYNDEYGHGKGDECLIKIAACMAEVLARPGDMLARYGGEEFVALLPETSAGQAKQVACKLIKAVKHVNIRHKTSPAVPRISISLGAANCLPDNNSSVEVLLQQADKALYRAKKQGRNRLCFDDKLINEKPTIV